MAQVSERLRIGVTGPRKGGRIPWLFTRRALRRTGVEVVRLHAGEHYHNTHFHGLIIGGGSHIHPSVYGAREEIPSARYDHERDHFERRLVELALDQGIPLLGICRGAQMINVACGGTLMQDINPLRDPANRYQTVRPKREVSVNVHSHLHRIVRKQGIRVNSIHRQAMKKIGKGLLPVAHDNDGVVQAVEFGNGDFVMGVQWHPEYLAAMVAHRRLFIALRDAAAAYRNRA